MFIINKKEQFMVPQLSFIHNRKKVERSKPSVVELRISAGKVRKYICTGVKVLPKEWKNGSIVGRKDWKELNDQLEVIRKKCSEIIVRLMEEGNFDVAVLPDMLKRELNQQQTFIAYAKELAERRKRLLSAGTQQHYKTLFDFLESWRGLISFSDVTEGTIRKMDEELEDRGLKVQSRWNYHKLVKMFIRNAVEDGLVKRNPYTSMNISRGVEDGLSRYLTPMEFHRLENCIIPVEGLRRVRDLFVFQTYTMMGYSDLEAFDYKKCFKMNGQMVYRSNRIKTDQPFTIVLLRPALEILKRYKYKLPLISNVKYNAYLKAAVMYAKIDKPVSTHWARHTGATMLLNEGKVPMHIVQHMLGHATIRETERTYAKVMEATIVESMIDYQRKCK